ncbi:MAG: GH1 family beta-glucosidase [Armatimonadota bacterium]
MRFPDGFVFGCATASYQIEGAAYEDGKGLSVWDMFCRKGGTVWQGQNGDVACDHYHRYREDVGIMKQIGLKGYRFSLSWPRIIPEGTGAVNEAGLGFYDRLVDELLAAGVEPFVTLFHWDYPYELYCRGGWLNPSSPDWFADYARVVVERLSDRVRHWMTLNEPQCFIGLGHYTGKHAPGDQRGLAEVLRAAHHSLLAHGKAVQVIRAHAKTKSVIGFAPVGAPRMPASDDPADIEAARQAMFAVNGQDLWANAFWMDPVFLGQYPPDALSHFGSLMPKIGGSDLATIAQPLDFFGVNTYSGSFVKAGADGKPESVGLPLGHPITAFKWWVTPEALYWGPRFFYERYRLPVIITENGMSDTDWVGLDGGVHDATRVDYLHRHLLQLARAMQDGVDVRGYFLWTLMDNFEWAEGVKERFGIVYTDFVTQQRVLKDSAYWYKEVIATRGEALGEPR